MPHNGRDLPDIDTLIANIRAEAKARFPDEQPEAGRKTESAGEGRASRGRAELRARVHRMPILGPGLRWLKSLALLTRTRAHAIEGLELGRHGAAAAQSLNRRVGDLSGDVDRLSGRVSDAETVADEARDTAERVWADTQSRVARTERLLRVARSDLRARWSAMERLQRQIEAGGDAIDVESPGAQPAAVSDSEMEAFFAAFDVALRGEASAIAEQLRAYLPDLDACGAGDEARPVLDLGCGRGTWLEVLRSEGYIARGIDLNRSLVDEAAAAGLDAQVEDALAALRACPDGSLGAITAFHLAEHLPFDTLYAVFAEALRTLAPGGLLLMETPNPENGYVGTHTFYHDPTHGNPLTPALMEFLADYHGYAEVAVRRVHPYPESARLPDGAPANERLNGWLCGPQDFALIARTRPAGLDSTADAAGAGAAVGPADS